MASTCTGPAVLLALRSVYPSDLGHLLIEQPISEKRNLAKTPDTSAHGFLRLTIVHSVDAGVNSVLRPGSFPPLTV